MNVIPTRNMAPVVVVNPQIIHASSDLVGGEEGCLSVPGQRFNILRHQAIEVRYQNLQGEWQQAELTDFIARIFQHEFDHLQGITLLERSRMPEQAQSISSQVHRTRWSAIMKLSLVTPLSRAFIAPALVMGLVLFIGLRLQQYFFY